MEWLNKALVSTNNEYSGVGIIKIAKRIKKSMKWCDHGMTTCDDHESGTYKCVECGQHLQDGLNYESGWIASRTDTKYIDRVIEARKNKDKILGMDDYNPYTTKEMAEIDKKWIESVGVTDPVMMKEECEHDDVDVERVNNRSLCGERV